jgi:hypothetical protein
MTNLEKALDPQAKSSEISILPWITSKLFWKEILQQLNPDKKYKI